MINKRYFKFILGIFIAIAGGATMLVSIIFGIIYFAGAMYEDIHTFPAKLSIPLKNMETASFTAKAEDDLSIWLKLPSSRQRGFRLLD